MKRTSNPLRFEPIFYAVSTSMLLATPVETFAFELQEDPISPSYLQHATVPTLSLDPVTASGLNMGTLNAFSEKMSERHNLPAPNGQAANGHSSSLAPCPSLGRGRQSSWKRPASN